MRGNKTYTCDDSLLKCEAPNDTRTTIFVLEPLNLWYPEYYKNKNYNKNIIKNIIMNNKNRDICGIKTSILKIRNIDSLKLRVRNSSPALEQHDY